ncbi:MAG: hypothetical protein KGY67_08815, partial [Candidatus Thermoplasmatota archaeon]|nr:hypothetical protein [Candidatus Thermoplasmatota archaeon]
MKQKMLKNLILKLSILLLILILISPLPLGLKSTNYTHFSSIQIENEITTEPYDLLIITPQEFTESLQELVDHKNRVGMKTKLVTLSEVYDNMFWQGRDDAEKIKYFIKESIETWDIEYVLLVGDFRLMPIRYVHNQDVQQGFNEPVFISELYYADIYNQDGSFSSWDTDNDAVFGEWYDDGVSTKAEDQPIDLYPDVAVGRLACRNKVEVKVLVDKIITYETQAYGSDWADDLLVCAGDTYPDMPTNEGEENTKHVLENMTDYDQSHLWTSDETLTGVRDIISAFNDGLGFVYFDGHANPFRWSTHPPGDGSTWIKGLSLITMSLLRNKDEYPIVVVGGCHNLQFDVHFQKIFEDPFYYFTWVPECWGWKLTRTINGGSVATLGCSGLGMTKEDKDSFSGAGDYLEPSFFYQVGVNNSEYLGDAWMNTLRMYLDKYPIDWDTPAAWDYAIDAKTVQQWVMLGDPSLKIGGYP